ncbi:MAG: hypothetical protein ABA06_02840 [Parcubacteria bacterium C7867-001]|nr:MAG: hypothetical protein ABA06_02840 [Parcubacteria bacterium C7867-001]
MIRSGYIFRTLIIGTFLLAALSFFPTTTFAAPGAGPGVGVSETTNVPDVAGPAADKPKTSGGACDLLGGHFDFGGCFATGIGMLVLTLANWLLAMAGYFFNLAMVYLVFGFPNLFGNSPGVIAAWQILRDLGNILLLFGFIFTGVGIILNLHDYNAKKTLPMLIIFALLLNFSLFVAEAIIDTSNALSSAVYTQASGGDVCSGKVVSDECIKSGISGRILQSTGIAGFLATPNAVPAGGFFEVAVVYIGLSIFVLCTAMVLFAGTIMLLIRAVVLVLLMVLAPIGFAGMALPFLNKQANDWWHALINQSFFAPVFLILIFVSLKISDSLQTVLGGSGTILDAITTGQANFMGVFVIFFLMIGFMIGSLIMAKQIGAYGAETATKIGGGFALGGMGFVGRRTIGAGSSMLANRVASSSFGRSRFGRFTYGVLNKGATSSFDARAGSVGKFVSGQSGLDLGKAGKDASHGIHGVEEAAVKARVEYANKLTQTEEEKAQEKTLKSQKSVLEAQEKEINKKWQNERVQLAKDIQTAQAAGKTGDVQKLQTQMAAKEAQKDVDLRNTKEAIENLTEELKTVDKNTGKRAYAQRIETQGISWPSVDKHANHEAAAKILKDISKTDNDRLVDAIGKIPGGGGGGGGNSGGGGGKSGGGGGAKPAGGH